MQKKIREYHDRLPLRGFFLHQKDDYIQIHFGGKQIRVYKTYGYIRCDTLFGAKRNKYHKKKKIKMKILKSKIIAQKFNTTFTDWNERKLRELR